MRHDSSFCTFTITSVASSPIPGALQELRRLSEWGAGLLDLRIAAHDQALQELELLQLGSLLFATDHVIDYEVATGLDHRAKHVNPYSRP